MKTSIFKIYKVNFAEAEEYVQRGDHFTVTGTLKIIYIIMT